MVSLAAALIARGNNALNTNPPQGTTISLTTHGSDWYWAVFCIMCVFALGFIISAFMRPRLERLFHYLAIGAAMFMALAYFSMASNLGNTGIQTEFSHYLGGGIRVIFYARSVSHSHYPYMDSTEDSRYIGWFLAGPLVLFCLTLFSGLHWMTTIFMAGLLEVYIVSGLIGALVRSSYKWGYFTFGLAAWLIIAYHFFGPGLISSRNLHADVRTPFLIGAGAIAFLWSLYPICWGLSEGGNVISPTSEGVFYGVLDILTMCVLAYLIWMVGLLGLTKFGIRFRDREMIEEGGAAAEKRAYGHEQQRSIDTGTTATGEYPARGPEQPQTGVGAGPGPGTGAGSAVGGPGTGISSADPRLGGAPQAGQGMGSLGQPTASYSQDYAYQGNREQLDTQPNTGRPKYPVMATGATGDRYIVPNDRAAHEGRVEIPVI
ncbi:uncharacterized protein V1513DRAFT_426666 [Lipomyces chichibuensis]|uniref:uncharacterized protein n=1 Tax=Lipomyces chichibuensis TaxID=1546026 RepID=UPI0033436ADE